MINVDEIPPMTHPLSKHWEQPATTDILIDHTHAVMSQDTFNELLEYSATVPSGVYDGKMWKAEYQPVNKYGSFIHTGEWWLRWYAPSDNPDKCSIFSRRILIV